MSYFKFFLFTQMVRFKKFWKFTILPTMWLLSFIFTL
nr:MAG TPA: hypothetical protein [Caudoviricetes sp.]